MKIKELSGMDIKKSWKVQDIKTTTDLFPFSILKKDFIDYIIKALILAYLKFLTHWSKQILFFFECINYSKLLNLGVLYKKT